jgi:hypothetical protein
MFQSTHPVTNSRKNSFENNNLLVRFLLLICCTFFLTGSFALPQSSIVPKGSCTGISVAYTTGLEDALVGSIDTKQSDPTYTHEVCITLDSGLNAGRSCTRTNSLFTIDLTTNTVTTKPSSQTAQTVCIDDFACRITVFGYQLSSDELLVAKVEKFDGGKITNPLSSKTTSHKLVCYVPVCSVQTQHRLSSLLINDEDSSDVSKKAQPSGIIGRSAVHKVNGAFSLQLQFTQSTQSATLLFEKNVTDIELYAKNAQHLMYYINSDQSTAYALWDSAQTNTPDVFNRIRISHSAPIEKITFFPAIVDGQSVPLPITAWLDAIQDVTSSSSTIVCTQSSANSYSFKPLSTIYSQTYTKETQLCTKIGTATFTGTNCCFGSATQFSDTLGACVQGRFVNHTPTDKTPLYDKNVQLVVEYADQTGELRTKSYNTFCSQNCTISFPPIPVSTQYIVYSPTAKVNQSVFTTQEPFRIDLLESSTALSETYSPLTCSQVTNSGSCSLTGSNICVAGTKPISFVFEIPQSYSQLWIPVHTFTLDSAKPGVRVESSFDKGLLQRFDGSYSSVRITFKTSNTFTQTQSTQQPSQPLPSQGVTPPENSPTQQPPISSGVITSQVQTQLDKITGISAVNCGGGYTQNGYDEPTPDNTNCPQLHTWTISVKDLPNLPAQIQVFSEDSYTQDMIQIGAESYVSSAVCVQSSLQWTTSWSVTDTPASKTAVRSFTCQQKTTSQTNPSNPVQPGSSTPPSQSVPSNPLGGSNPYYGGNPYYGSNPITNPISNPIDSPIGDNPDSDLI